MREIKFRFWSIVDNQYVGCYDVDPGGRWMHVGAGDQLYYTNDVDAQEFVMEQYIGIKDKNGKEIYEGDLIRYQNNSNLDSVVFTVKWSDESLGWIIWAEKEGCCLTNDRFINQFNHIEIIGNIHENKNLL